MKPDEPPSDPLIPGPIRGCGAPVFPDGTDGTKRLAAALANRRAALEAEIHKAVRLFEEETGFGVKEVKVYHPVTFGEFEAVRWAPEIPLPLPSTVACSLYSSVLSGLSPVGPNEVDATHLLPDVDPPEGSKSFPYTEIRHDAIAGGKGSA